MPTKGHRYEERQSLNITVYTKPNCQPCKATRRKLDQFSLDYSTVELDDELRRRFVEADLLSAPVVEVEFGDDATLSWSGYRPSQIEKLAELL